MGRTWSAAGFVVLASAGVSTCCTHCQVGCFFEFAVGMSSFDLTIRTRHMASPWNAVFEDVGVVC